MSNSTDFPIGTPLTEYLHLDTQQCNENVAKIILAITEAAVGISDAVRRGQLAGVLGSADTSNIQGEIQQTLDVLADQAIIAACRACSAVRGVVSEEMDDLLDLANPSGTHLVVYDPLDGSSNIDVNLSIGTIFSVLADSGEEVLTNDAFLKRGIDQVAAGYVIYGPQTSLVFSIGKGTIGFTLDPQDQQFKLTTPRYSISEHTKEFAINMSNQRFWQPPIQRYVAELLDGKTGGRGKDFNMRWIASMVAEVHRILNRGGVFMYPRDNKDPAKAGRLRLLYEANPMSFIVEQAGGKTSNGHTRILEVLPESLHERIAVVLGASNEVDLVTSYHRP